MFGINPKKIQGMMKRMGISQQPIDAKKVIIELENSQLVIDEPSVTRINMQGQETYQIAGEAREEEKASEQEEKQFCEEDVKMVMEKTGASKNQVKKSLEQNKGDIALTIMDLKG